MPIRNFETYLQDIIQSGENIQVFLKEFTLDAYEQDLKTRSAVERQLMILTEAVIRLKSDAESLLPGIDCLKIRGLGNFMRHEYENVQDHRIWETVHVDLPLLIKVAKQSLERVGKNESKELS